MMKGSTMKTLLRGAAAAWCVALALVAPAAHAGLFDDAEARRAIVDLREKVAKLIEQQKVRETESASALEQIAQIKRSLLDLNSQLELNRADAAKLRGQNEQLAQAIAEMQRDSRDTRQALDDRVRKLEPQTVSVDGKEFPAGLDEQRQFEDALALLRKGDFAAASAGFVAFQRRFPSSGYNDSVLFWLGNAQYAQREYKESMVSFRALVASSPAHPKAAEALLSVASCQTELKDIKGARRTLEELLKQYPKTEAAQAAKERLPTLK
jgi:tol-pal system protein YbgF